MTPEEEEKRLLDLTIEKLRPRDWLLKYKYDICNSDIIIFWIERINFHRENKNYVMSDYIRNQLQEKCLIYLEFPAGGGTVIATKTFLSHHFKDDPILKPPTPLK